ncbi:Protein YrdA [Psychrobacter sp. SC65A.3]|uniref:gamma carbonic anhydrase family protein n=1 Tax=Psychrobacter sp. SC65A.3 TaxID=2983299 RepID=UPI0021DA91A5|nr:hypothetical protein [Psychrobacter sp. SC65A.3]WAI88146.1 Protein YrdA [Psychrobacter sp. SC65A.3]
MIYKYLDKSPKFANAFNGWVANFASVIGDVYLGHQASVWFDAVVLGDIEHIHISKYSNVQEKTVIHADKGTGIRTGNHVTIGHLAMLHGC